MAAPARKTALVTAGSAGLGAAIARVLALELGMSVTINYHSNADRAKALVKELQDAWAARQATDTTQAPPPVFHAIRADICKRSEIIRLVEETTTASGGRLDAVVSNVGWTRMRDFSDLEDGVDEEDWDRCFGANVKAHLWLFHAAKKWLEEANARKEGSAVFVSTASIAGCKPSGSSLVCKGEDRIPKPYLRILIVTKSELQPYAVTKAAQIHLIKSLAVIAAPSIRVNCVSPGVLLTVCSTSSKPILGNRLTSPPGRTGDFLFLPHGSKLSRSQTS